MVFFISCFPRDVRENAAAGGCVGGGDRGTRGSFPPLLVYRQPSSNPQFPACAYNLVSRRVFAFFRGVSPVNVKTKKKKGKKENHTVFVFPNCAQFEQIPLS